MGSTIPPGHRPRKRGDAGKEAEAEGTPAPPTPVGPGELQGGEQGFWTRKRSRREVLGMGVQGFMASVVLPHYKGTPLEALVEGVGKAVDKSDLPFVLDTLRDTLDLNDNMLAWLMQVDRYGWPPPNDLDLWMPSTDDIHRFRDSFIDSLYRAFPTPKERRTWLEYNIRMQDALMRRMTGEPPQSGDEEFDRAIAEGDREMHKRTPEQEREREKLRQEHKRLMMPPEGRFVKAYDVSLFLSPDGTRKGDDLETELVSLDNRLSDEEKGRLQIVILNTVPGLNEDTIREALGIDRLELDRFVSVNDIPRALQSKYGLDLPAYLREEYGDDVDITAVCSDNYPYVRKDTSDVTVIRFMPQEHIDDYVVKAGFMAFDQFRNTLGEHERAVLLEPDGSVNLGKVFDVRAARGAAR